MIYAEVVSLRKGYKRKSIEYEVNENGCWICTSHYLRDGYPQIESNREMKNLNRVVLERSLGRKIKEGFGALHKCGNRVCINPDHIYEGSREDNARDSKRHGTFVQGEDHPKSKLTEAQVLEIRKSILSGPELGKIYGVGRGCINNIKRRVTWKHLKDQPS